jgi:predicted anti-sigma-YlaC factor YlaD
MITARNPVVAAGACGVLGAFSAAIYKIGSFRPAEDTSMKCVTQSIITCDPFVLKWVGREREREREEGGYLGTAQGFIR